MKSDYPREKDTNINPIAPTTASSNPTANMFSRFQQHHHHHPLVQYQSIHLQPQTHHNFHLTKDPQTSEEADSSSPATTATIKKPRLSAEDGETIEVVRRPKGRPPGSKNRPKSQTTTTTSRPPPPTHHDTTPVSYMFPYVFEIPSGVDIVTSLTRFTRLRGTGVSVLSASGSVASVTLGQPTGIAVSFQGRFEMLALSALLLPVAVGNLSSVGGGAELNGVFTVSLAGSQGQVVGGRVVGPLVAAGTVFVVAAGFNNPTYHRINPVDHQEDSGEMQVSSASPGVSGGGGGGGCEVVGTAAAAAGVMYGGHLGSSSDVIWAPTARPPHQHPPPPY